MGNGGVSEPQPLTGGEDEEPPPVSYKKLFLEHLPFYLSIGMTADEYWHGDPELARYYRKAEELRMKKKNDELWLQGLYIYNALCSVSPVLHAFAKPGTKVHPYMDEPIPRTYKEIKEYEERQARKRMERMKAIVSAWAKSVNDKSDNTDE